MCSLENLYSMYNLYLIVIHEVDLLKQSIFLVISVKRLDLKSLESGLYLPVTVEYSIGCSVKKTMLIIAKCYDVSLLPPPLCSYFLVIQSCTKILLYNNDLFKGNNFMEYRKPIVEDLNQQFSTKWDLVGGFAFQGTFVLSRNFLLPQRGWGGWEGATTITQWAEVRVLLNILQYMGQPPPIVKIFSAQNVISDEVEKHCYKLMLRNTYVFNQSYMRLNSLIKHIGTLACLHVKISQVNMKVISKDSFLTSTCFLPNNSSVRINFSEISVEL